MKRLASLPASALAIAALTVVAGCGRSDLIGAGGVDTCPPGQGFDGKGHCVSPPDMAMRPPPMHDGFVPPTDDFSIPPTDDGFIPPTDDGFIPPTIDLASADLSGGCGSIREICNNGIDDNCNGLIDCQDPECAGDPACVVPGHEICNNGIDDDNNGLTDCADPACKNFPGCQPHMCDPMHIDCADPACVQLPQCQNLVCKPSVDFGTLAQHDAKSERAVSTVGTMDVAITPCSPGGGGMVVTQFTVASDATAVTLAFTQDMGGDHVFSVYREGVGQACAANPVDNPCYDPKGAPSGKNTWVLGAGHYFLIVQAFTVGHQGGVDVTLTTPPMAKKEICDNGIDDDMNGLTDCADPACFNDPHCKNSECKPDINVGTLVLGDPPKMASFDTNNQGSKYIVGCAGGKGQDVAVEFSLKETLGVLMNWDQTGDHVVGLFQLPAAGQNCDAIPLGCYDPSGRPQDQVAWGELGAGHYLFVFQAIHPGNEGHIDVQLSAYQNRKVEICHNGIDDDNNGLTDCMDPACFADPGCGAPVCQPDISLGTLHLGQQVTTQVDTTKGILNEIVSCAKGGGKARILSVTLAENAGMGFACQQQSGDAVFGLFAEAGPRDPCDKNEVDCADPKIIPFGCDYEIPNLQPGTYFIIAEAFQAGTEGKLTLTVSSIKDRALEICNNGIDDDMDGFTDCGDRKCATSPFCINKQCKADATIDPMPIGGNAVFKLVQTAGQQVSAQPPCEVKPGGGDAVVYLNMPAQATLTVGYAQIGSHVFALYPDQGSGLICEASKALQCTPSMGAGAGTVTFPKLAQGKYWFIAAADQPGNEGSVSLKFTAAP